MDTKVVEIALSEKDIKDIIEGRVASCFVSVDMLTTILVRMVKKPKYAEGTKVITKGEDYISGEVIPNFKLPGDICVRWETGQELSYDKKWLDENVTIIKGD